MFDFCVAFILILIFVYPALKIIVFSARSINKNFPQDVPIIFNLILKSGTSIIKTKHINEKTGKPYANTDEMRLATISSIVLAGFMAALITGFYLLPPIIIWVVIISISVSFVESN